MLNFHNFIKKCTPIKTKIKFLFINPIFGMRLSLTIEALAKLAFLNLEIRFFQKSDFLNLWNRLDIFPK
ncbi:MAG: hypothetical protein DRQ57_03005 [Gammaproteobacteria bacterium]|nr:MAG: hypothetical protein DRQ57_03005 [Gammaproteobacteria bacterium]